jgi:hypothetical protein
MSRIGLVGAMRPKFSLIDDAALTGANLDLVLHVSAFLVDMGGRSRASFDKHAREWTLCALETNVAFKSNTSFL